jgi:hypothetical protein
MQTETALPPAEREISRFPCKKRRHMPGSLTTPGCPSTRVGVLDHIAFRYLYSVGTQLKRLAARRTSEIFGTLSWILRMANSNPKHSPSCSQTSKWW